MSPINSTSIPPLLVLQLVNLIRRLQALHPRVAATTEEFEGLLREFPDLIRLLGVSAATLPQRMGLLRADASRRNRPSTGSSR